MSNGIFPKLHLDLSLMALLLCALPALAKGQDYRLRELVGDEKAITKPCGPYQDSLLPLLERNFSYPLSRNILPELERWERACGPVEPLLRTRLLYQHSVDRMIPSPDELLDYYGFYLRQLATRQNAPRYYFTPASLSYWDYTIQGAQKLQERKKAPSLTLQLLGSEDFHEARKHIWRSPLKTNAQKALRDTVRELLFPRQFYEMGLYYQQFYGAAAQRLKPTAGFHFGIGGAWNQEQSLSLEFNLTPIRARDEWRISYKDSIYQDQGSFAFAMSLMLRQQIWASSWQEGSLLLGLGFQSMGTGVEVWASPEAQEKTPITLNSYKVSGGLEWTLYHLGTRRLAWRLQYHLQDFNQGTTAISDFKGNAATVSLIYIY